jgi:hypothetical protein
MSILRTQEQPQNVNQARPKTYWETAIDQGRAAGRELFRDPEMTQLRQRREDLSQGYSGQELGALREGARQEIAGQRAGYLQAMRSNMARQGVGGARAAAMQGTADQRLAQTGADAERKMPLDSAQLKRQGVGDLQDFVFRQRLGELATGVGYGQIGQAERSSEEARKALAEQERNKKPDIIGNLIAGGPLGLIKSFLG